MATLDTSTCPSTRCSPTATTSAAAPSSDPASASLELRPGLGRLPKGWPLLADPDDEPPAAEPEAMIGAHGRGDTTHCDAVDHWGNLASCTPSGGWLQSSPAVPELGFPVGTRAQMFVLDPVHPNALAPGKRPRTTLTPSLAELPDGRRIAFGTPGGDQQDQWSLQFLLNLLDFGFDDLQAAIDAPTVHSEHWPSSFYPRLARPGLVDAEDRIAAATLSELERPRPPPPSCRPLAAWPRHGRLVPPGRRPLRGRRLAPQRRRLRHRASLGQRPLAGCTQPDTSCSYGHRTSAPVAPASPPSRALSRARSDGSPSDLHRARPAPALGVQGRSPGQGFGGEAPKDWVGGWEWPLGERPSRATPLPTCSGVESRLERRDHMPSVFAEPLAGLVARQTDDLNASIEDLDDDELQAQAMEGHPSIGFHAWHVLRTIDNIVNFVFYRDPPVWTARRLHQQWGLPKVDQGTGMALDEATAMRFPGTAPLVDYGVAVREAARAKIEAMDDDFPARNDAGARRRPDDGAPAHSRRSARP